jgi:hypothetical protein
MRRVVWIHALVFLAGLAVAPTLSWAEVRLRCRDAEKPCAAIDIDEGNGRASVAFSGCTATPGRYFFTQGSLRSLRTGEVFHQYVADNPGEIYFGEEIEKGITAGQKRAFHVNLRKGTGVMIISPPVQRREFYYSMVCDE